MGEPLRTDARRVEVKGRAAQGLRCGDRGREGLRQVRGRDDPAGTGVVGEPAPAPPVGSAATTGTTPA
jgi:hypothetical protein